MTVAQQKQVIARAAATYGIDPAILWGVYGTETGFGANVRTSSAGAVGPFQFEPGTARSLGVDPYNFTSAANGAAKYLAQFQGRGIDGMLSAYNAGPAGALQPSYVASVLRNARTWGTTPATNATPAASTSSSTGSSTGSGSADKGGLVSHDQAHGALYALVWFGLVLAGGILILAGVNHATHGAPVRVAKAAAKTTAAAE